MTHISLLTGTACDMSHTHTPPEQWVRESHLIQ